MTQQITYSKLSSDDLLDDKRSLYRAQLDFTANNNQVTATNYTAERNEQSQHCTFPYKWEINLHHHSVSSHNSYTGIRSGSTSHTHPQLHFSLLCATGTHETPTHLQLCSNILVWLTTTGANRIWHFCETIIQPADGV